MKKLMTIVVIIALVIPLTEARGRVGSGRRAPTRRPSRPTRPTRPTQPRSTPPSRPAATPVTPETPGTSGQSGQIGQNQGDELGFVWATRPGLTNRNPMDVETDWLPPRLRARRERADARDRERARLADMARTQELERDAVPIPSHWQNSPRHEPMVNMWRQGQGHQRIRDQIDQMPLVGIATDLVNTAAGQSAPTAAPRTTTTSESDEEWLRRRFN